MLKERKNIPNPFGAPGMEDRSWVKEKTVAMGMTTISFRCRKPKTTVAIMMRKIMIVISPIHMGQVNYIIHESIGKEDGQNVKVTARQYTITRVLRLRDKAVSKIWSVSCHLGGPAGAIANWRLLKRFYQACESDEKGWKRTQ